MEYGLNKNTDLDTSIYKVSACVAICKYIILSIAYLTFSILKILFYFLIKIILNI